MLLVAWISIGTQLKMAQRIIRFPQKPVSVEGCNANWLEEYLTLSSEPDIQSKPFETPFMLYRVSYMYYTMIGAVTAIVVGLIVSKFTGSNKNKIIERDLLSPVIYRFLKDGDRKENYLEEMKVTNEWRVSFQKNGK